MRECTQTFVPSISQDSIEIKNVVVQMNNKENKDGVVITSG